MELIPPGLWIRRNQVRFAHAWLVDGVFRWYILGPDTLVPEGKLVTLDAGGWDFGSVAREETKLITRHVAERVVNHRDGPPVRYVLAEFS